MVYQIILQKNYYLIIIFNDSIQYWIKHIIMMKFRKDNNLMNPILSPSEKITDSHVIFIIF